MQSAADQNGKGKGEEEGQGTCLGYCCPCCSSINSCSRSPVARLPGSKSSYPILATTQIDVYWLQGCACPGKGSWGGGEHNSISPTHLPHPKYTAWCCPALPSSYGWARARHGCFCNNKDSQQPCHSQLIPTHPAPAVLLQPWTMIFSVSVFGG